MATNDLQRVRQELRLIKEEAQSAQQKIATLRKDLEALIAASARGGGTATGIRGATDRLLLGAGRRTADPRTRIGGGDRVNIVAMGEQIQRDIDTYTQAVVDYNIAQFRKLQVVGRGTRPVDIETRFQQVLQGMEQAFLARLGQLESIFLGGGIAGALPPGGYTPASLVGAGLGPPQLPAGTPAYGRAVNPPLLPAATGFRDIEPDPNIIEGKIRDVTDSVDTIIIEERKLLEAVSRSTRAAQAEAQAREEAAALIDQVGRPAAGTPTDEEIQRRERILETRQRRQDVRQQFRQVYGQDAGPERLQAVQQQAQRYGFSLSDVKTVDTYANAYTRVGYAVKDFDGIMRRLTVTVDKAGNTLVSTQKQFRTFFGAIRRNIGEMIKWSAAVLLVWGSIRRLQELVSLAIDNETQLANVAVVLGEAHADLARVFEDAADAAFATGESINGVIEGYAAAYRATGNIENQTERSRVAQQLLTDSLVLSKLSTLNQAEALDTLVGALRQVGLDLDQGSQLMDKWVRVSRFAQVSIETLAESFAITATSASNAGVDIEYLNGLIATIAEVTTLSASESGNAIRAFISSFKSDSAVKELGQFGIAVKDLDGETRGFLDIMQEIAALFESGVISEQQLNRIGRAIGGRGARREAQVVAVIKNLTRAEELAAIQTDATGEAQAALNIQLETVQTSLTRLDNSFLTLARTMGSEGGILNATDAVLGLFTQLLDTTSALTKNLGSLTPIMAGLGLALAATSAQSRLHYYSQGALGVGTGLERISPRLGTGAFNALTRPGFGRGAQFLGGGAAQLGAVGLTAFSAAGAAGRGDYASAGGAIAGAFVGAAITGGNPIGIAIGTAAGQALASAIFNYEPEFENFFKDTVGAAVTEPAKAEEIADPIQLAMERAFEVAGTTTFGRREIGGGNEFLGRGGANIAAWFQNQLIGAGRFVGIEGEFTTPEQEALRTADALGRGDEVRRLLDEAKRFQEAQRGTDATAGFDFEFINQQQDYLDEYGDYLDQLEEIQSRLARSRALSGDITERELRTSLEVIPKLQAGISSFAVGFGDEFQKLNPQLKDANSTMDAFARILINNAPEQIEYLSSINSEVARLTNLLQIAEETGEDFIVFKPDDPSTVESEEIVYNLEEANAVLKRNQQDAALLATALHQAAQAAFIDLPTITTLDVKPEDLQKVFSRAREEQREYIRATFAEDLNRGISIEEIEATFDPIMIQAGESGGFTYAEGFMQAFLTGVIPAMQAAGEIIAPAPTALPIRQLDISSGQLPAVMARYNQLVENIRTQAAAGGFEVDLTEETFAGLLTDFVAVPITANLSLLNLGMNELIDVNKKQLEGVYNLPTDASFYVPFQGYELGLGQDGGGGLGGAAGALTDSATDLRSAASELRNAALAQERIVHGRAMARSRGEGEPGADIPVVRFTGDTEPRVDDTWRRYLENLPELYGVEETSLLEELVKAIDRLILGTTDPQPLAPAPFFDQPVPEPRDREAPGLLERFLDLFINSGIFGFTGVGQGAGAGFDPSATFDRATNRFENAVGTFESFALPQGPVLPGANLGGGGLADITSNFGSVIDLLSQKITNLSGFTTNLKISSTSTTQLIVDGRTLAEVVKPYLYSDMIRFEDSASSVTKTIVV